MANKHNVPHQDYCRVRKSGDQFVEYDYLSLDKVIPIIRRILREAFSWFKVELS